MRRWFSGSSRSQFLGPGDAASRISAFVYGNILVMAALVALHPDNLLEPRALAYVCGTAVSTFVAHLLAESVGTRVRTDQRLTREHLLHGLRDSVPIISSATAPALVLGAALLGLIEPSSALLAAIAVTALRLSALGWVIARLRGRRPSSRTFVSGVLLAVTCLAAAVLKGWLTH